MVKHYSISDNLILQKDPWYYSYLYIIYIVVAMVYLIWRLIFTLSWHFWFSWVIFSCDIYIVITTTIFLITTRRIYLPLWHKSSKKPSVDIFIPTYNEPLEIVEMTTIAALQIDGISNVLVLDDSNRSEIKKMAKEVGALYFARKDNSHAKAGNLNFGLQYSHAEFILNVDCDHIPAANFLERTLGYFDDENLAFIQTPQVFYNHDSIQHRKTENSNLWNEQTMFYESIQPAKNIYNAAFFCGSGALIRRAALDSVGGYATNTATEDIHTSIRLHAKGWQSLFITEKLAFGLAAEDIREYHKQRVRWGAGSLGLLFRSSDSPLWIRGLSFMQRLCYIYSTSAYLYGIQKIIYFFAPIATIFWLTRSSIPLIYYFSFYLPFLLFSYVLTYIYSRQTFHFPYTEQYDILNIFSHIESLKGIFTIQKKFGVSIKLKPIKEKSLVYYTLIMLAIFMIIIDVYGIMHWSIQKPEFSILYSNNILIGVFWNSFNLLFVLSTLLFLNNYYKKAKNDTKFIIDKPTFLEPDMIDGTIKLMCLTNVIIKTNSPLKSKHIVFSLNNVSNLIKISATVKSIKKFKSHYEITMQISKLTLNQKKQLISYFINYSIFNLFNADLIEKNITRRTANIAIVIQD